MPLSPTSSASVPEGLKAIDLIAFVPVSPLVLIRVTKVPLNLRTVPLRPPISAYWPFGFHATVFRSLVVPVANDLIVDPSYVLRPPLLPDNTTSLPLGCQLCERIVVPPGLLICVADTPSYFSSSPTEPPISAYDPSCFQETDQKLKPVEIPVGTVVSDVPSYFSSVEKSPTISA